MSMTLVNPLRCYMNIASRQADRLLQRREDSPKFDAVIPEDRRVGHFLR